MNQLARRVVAVPPALPRLKAAPPAAYQLSFQLALPSAPMVVTLCPQSHFCWQVVALSRFHPSDGRGFE